MAGAVLERGQFVDSPHSLIPETQKSPETPQISGLQREIAYLRENWQKERLEENWRDLPEVGFMIGYQMGFLESEKFQGLTFEERKSRWIGLTNASLQSWTKEYLAGSAILPGLQSIKFENGEWVYGDSFHGAGLPLEETLSKKEGNGVVWDTYINKVKPLFATNEDIPLCAVVDSPSGKRMPDESGELIEFPDSRITFLEKKGSDIFTFTIANELEYDEHAEFMTALRRMAGQEDANLSENSTGEDIIASPALFSGENVTLQDIIQAMGKVREKRGKRFLYKDKTVEDVLAETRGDMWDYDETTKLMIQEFGEYADSFDWAKDDLQEALAVTILRLSRYVLQTERDKKTVTFSTEGAVLFDNSRPDPRMMSYGETFNDVVKIQGCAGGGKKVGFKEGFDKSYKALLGKGETETCDTCGEDKSDNHYHCHKETCKRKYADETNVAADKRTKKCACGQEFGC